ncbi:MULTISPECIES: hypothetical protein [unclassified Nocardioides]|uniref:hypothetical protein n=1 Tax=unclassified Nocardioides TaxID=2615069 RepID=UPI0006F86138|nr:MULTISPECIES: hypothetical protein [unclassified Nocardioides]KQY50885.1 hypothetical protein ASD30_20565 [Nocardioides sp. Root140]KRF14692.1 hypothetical protein ASH02_10345 [Nocardioides sp. Soil796]
MMRRLLVLAAAVATGVALLATPASASAGTDLLTEDSTRVVVDLNGVQHERHSGNCSVTNAAPTATLKCARDRGDSLIYKFEIPGAAINLRTQAMYDVLAKGPYSDTGSFGMRMDRRTYGILVHASNANLRVNRVRLIYDLPTRRDARACVTTGEWLSVQPDRGGLYATLSRVETVFDSSGKQVRLTAWHGDLRSQVRTYRRCGSDRTYRVTYFQLKGYPYWFSLFGSEGVIVTIEEARQLVARYR